MRKLGLLLLLIAAQAFGQASICVPPGRLDFASVPEIPLVRGYAETVQLGIFQLDPANPWTPGDLDRSSGWTSRFETELVDAASGLPVAGLSYHRMTAELTYDGQSAADWVVRIRSTEGKGESAPFRIRALTPSVVYGVDASQINTDQEWQAARVCDYPAVSFSACRSQGWGPGAIDAQPVVLFITPGTYERQDFFLGNRRYLYVLSDPANRAKLVGDTLATGNAPVIFHIRNLNLESRISLALPYTDSPTSTYISNVSECCETRDGNGIFTGGGKTRFPWLMYVWNFDARMMGSPSNLQHWAYIEGRPLSEFHVNNVRILGTRGSSAVKSTMQTVTVRNSLFCVTETCEAPTGPVLTMHTPIDVPAFSTTIVYNNEFRLWRGPTAGARDGTSGILSAGIFWRLRQNQWGSDIPAYPNVSWDPPVTSQTTNMSPGGGWSGGPETFVDPLFWADVKLKPITDPTNGFSYKHYIGFNKFVQLVGSLPVRVLRDDGTHPVEPPSPGGLKVVRTADDWIERSMTWMYGNTYVGFDENQRLIVMDSSQAVESIAPGAKWPRDADEEFPHFQVPDGPLPDWFRL